MIIRWSGHSPNSSLTPPPPVDVVALQSNRAQTSSAAVWFARLDVGRETILQGLLAWVWPAWQKATWEATWSQRHLKRSVPSGYVSQLLQAVQQMGFQMTPRQGVTSWGKAEGSPSVACPFLSAAQLFSSSPALPLFSSAGKDAICMHWSAWTYCK